MILSAILVIYFLTLGWLPTPQIADSAPTSQSQAPALQSPEPTSTSPAASGQTPNAAAPAKSPQTKPHHKKKTIPSNCSNSPTPPNPAAGIPTDSTNSAGTGPTNTASTNAASPIAGPTNAIPTNAEQNATSAPPKPCPPPKKVIRNGGSDEPTIQLKGGTNAEQASHQGSTEELAVATQENLKKIAERQLNPSQQEMVNQIKQFMEQCKTAVAAGDLERGHSLALKAHLLSDELVKP